MPLSFRTHRKRAQHFYAHATDFGAISEVDYEQKASAFMSCPLPADCEERIRISDGDTIRFNKVTQEFGITSFDGYIRTYYKPDPAVHGEATNYDYYLKV